MTPADFQKRINNIIKTLNPQDDVSLCAGPDFQAFIQVMRNAVSSAAHQMDVGEVEILDLLDSRWD